MTAATNSSRIAATRARAADSAANCTGAADYAAADSAVDCATAPAVAKAVNCATTASAALEGAKHSFQVRFYNNPKGRDVEFTPAKLADMYWRADAWLETVDPAAPVVKLICDIDGRDRAIVAHPPKVRDWVNRAGVPSRGIAIARIEVQTAEGAPTQIYYCATHYRTPTVCAFPPHRSQETARARSRHHPIARTANSSALARLSTLPERAYLQIEVPELRLGVVITLTRDTDLWWTAQKSETTGELFPYTPHLTFLL